MKKFTLLFLSLMVFGTLQAQLNFDEEIVIEDWSPLEVVLPPSPLTVKPLFIGGYDIVQTTPTYGNPAGRAIAKEWHDFIGWTPDTTGASLGWVTVNHEMIYQDDRIGDGGGMTAFRVDTDDNDEIQVIEQTLEDGRTGHFFNVDFVNTVGETGMNCAGISAPNGRIWTAEEWFRTSYASINTGNTSSSSLPHHVSPDGRIGNNGVRDLSDFTINAPEFTDVPVDGLTIPKWQNFNYMVEVDPREAKAIRKQYNWGRGGWEGGAITEDGRYVYLGDDASPAAWIRVVASTPWDFVNGIEIQAFKENNPAGQRWITIPRDTSNIFDAIRTTAFEMGATMYMRNEWVAIDQESGVVYWTATGRDGAGQRFFDFNQEYPDALPAQGADAYARSIGFDGALDTDYPDYYGRIYYYNPETNEVGVAINGGPYFADGSPSEADYPEKHLSNPDGLKVVTIAGEKFLMINEDLNGTSNGRTPDGVSNRLCELFLLSIDKVMDGTATYDDLIRITGVPRGAEVTGSIQISDDVILFNAQHPNAENPFPYNHSLTLAISGFSNVETSSLEGPSQEELEELKIYPNPTTRSVFLPSAMDFAIYDSNGRRVSVFRNTREALVDHLAAGVYYIITEDQQSFKLVVE